MILIKRFKDWIAALRRGEKRVAPQGVRGRVYAKRDGSVDANPGHMPVTSKPTLTITPARVWVDAEQRWYSVDEHRAKFGPEIQ